jgi:hypothetical protein
MGLSMNPISIIIGKISGWLIVGLIVAIIGMGGVIYILRADLKVAQSKSKLAEEKLAIQNALIEANRIEYEKNLADAKASKEIVRVETKLKIKIVEKWRETNATCIDSINYLNAYTF